MSKIRADELVFRQQLAPSRSNASQMIKEGLVFLPDGTPVRKPGQMLDSTIVLTATETMKYVSRGAGKLLAALDAFNPEIAGKTALDLGASTGGFTDVLLSYGAVKVYAVDVGTGQLHEKLRSDPRVVSLEQTNARDLNKTLIPDPIQILTGDLSFISLTKVLPACVPLLDKDFFAILLIKPQFEAERGEIGSGGVVRSQEVRERCVAKIVDFAVNELHWRHIGTIESPVIGPNGNHEFLAAFR